MSFRIFYLLPPPLDSGEYLEEGGGCDFLLWRKLIFGFELDLVRGLPHLWLETVGKSGPLRI